MPCSKPNTSAPKTAVPKTAPRLRDSETMAAAAPSRWRPASVWMVTCAVGITVPNPIPQTNPQAAMVHGAGASTPSSSSMQADSVKPIRGIGVGRPVLATMRPVVVDPVTMPNVNGSSSRPEWLAATPAPSCR